MKKQRTWLEQKVAEYCFELRISLAQLSKKIGFKRQQVQDSMRGKIPMSARLAKALSKEMGLDYDLVQLVDGTLPQDILKVCRSHPDQLYEVLTRVSQRLRGQ